MKHLEHLQCLSPAEIRDILKISRQLKARLHQGERPQLLSGYTLAQIFEKPSLRTRLSFDVAMGHLGGTSLFFSTTDIGLNGRESLPDVARVLSSYCDAIVIRAFSQQLIEEIAKHATCPVINGLSDVSHPCQALADMLTIEETFGTLQGKTVVFVGDGNNVARSLATASSKMGVRFILSSPQEYAFKSEYLELVHRLQPGFNYRHEPDPVRAVAEADIVYTDVWASMGQEAEATKRQKAFAAYQVNAKLMAAAPRTARFMHCLPARRGMEVTDDVMDSPQSIAFQQAENRFHSAKGILLWLLGKSDQVDC